MTASGAALHGPLLATGSRRVDTVFGPFQLASFRNLETHRSCFALARGDVGGKRPLLARVHSSCVTSEFFGACDCDCAAQLDDALEEIAREGRGVLYYLDQEGRGAGLAAKARDRMLVQASRQRLTTFEAYELMGLQPDLRRYHEVASITRLLGVTAPLVLLTNNPDKAAALEREKLRIARLQPIERAASPFNAHYLSAKRRSGHVLADASGTLDAELPSSVAALAPTPLPGRPELVRVARYWLPVRPEWRRARPVPPEGDPLWLELQLHVDVELGGEIVVLTLDDAAEGADAPALVRIHPEPVLERLPLLRTPARDDWTAVAREITAHGCGVVAFSQRSASGAPGASEREGALEALIAHHLGGRSAIPLHAPGEDDPAGRLAGSGLGIALEPARPFVRRS